VSLYIFNTIYVFGEIWKPNAGRVSGLHVSGVNAGLQQSMWAERERWKFPLTAHIFFSNPRSLLRSRSHDLPLPLHGIFSRPAPAQSIFGPGPLHFPLALPLRPHALDYSDWCGYALLKWCASAVRSPTTSRSAAAAATAPISSVRCWHRRRQTHRWTARHDSVAVGRPRN